MNKKCLHTLFEVTSEIRSQCGKIYYGEYFAGFDEWKWCPFCGGKLELKTFEETE